MATIDKIFLQKEYDFYKKKAGRYVEKNKFEDALICISYCAYIAYSYPFREKFCDDDLEFILDQITSATIGTNIINGTKNKYVFYDAHFVDTAGLTQQYIRFLKDINAEVLVILNDSKQLSTGQNILKEIKGNPNFILFVPVAKTKTGKIKEISKKVIEFNAATAFLHFTPWDVVGYTVFGSFQNMERYFINLTDHTFWLGKGCSDYFLEFRSFGYNLSHKYRGIDKDKLLFNPYYPIMDNLKFEGFDFNVEGKVIGFIGANLYKLNLDPELRYLHAIKELLFDNENFIFIIAGFGNIDPLLSFIKNNNLSERMFFLGKRKDISEVIRNIDIYFNSYPFCGGLTTQFAVNHKKAIIGLADKELYSLNALEDLLNAENYRTVTNLVDFKLEANSLINQLDYRKNNISVFEKSVPSRDQFKENLLDIISLKKKSICFNIKPLIFDHGSYLSLYLSLENTIEKSFYYNKMIFFRKNLIKISFVEFFKTSFSVLFKNQKRLRKYFFK